MTFEPRHAQRADDDVTRHVRAQAPADHLTAEQVDHHGQEQPAFVGGDVRDIARPALVWLCHGELPVEQVWRDWQVVIAIGGDLESAPSLGTYAVQLHELLNTFLAHTDASGQQLPSSARPAVAATSLGAHGLAVHAGELPTSMGLDPVKQRLFHQTQRTRRCRNALTTFDQPHLLLLELERVTRPLHRLRHFRSPCFDLTTQQGIRSSWARSAGLADVRIHDLRHSYASFLVNAGRSLYEVQRLLGRTQIKTTQRYAHLSHDTLLDATNSVNTTLAGMFVPMVSASPVSQVRLARV